MAGAATAKIPRPPTIDEQVVRGHVHGYTYIYIYTPGEQGTLDVQSESWWALRDSPGSKASRIVGCFERSQDFGKTGFSLRPPPSKDRDACVSKISCSNVRSRQRGRLFPAPPPGPGFNRAPDRPGRGVKTEVVMARVQRQAQLL